MSLQLRLILRLGLIGHNRRNSNFYWTVVISLYYIVILMGWVCLNWSCISLERNLIKHSLLNYRSLLSLRRKLWMLCISVRWKPPILKISLAIFRISSHNWLSCEIWRIWVQPCTVYELIIWRTCLMNIISHWAILYSHISIS